MLSILFQRISLQNLLRLLTPFVILFTLIGCSQTQPSEKKVTSTLTQQDVQIYSMSNLNAAITPQTIEDAFTTVGLSVLGNNDMNKPFSKRFGKVHYKIYNLAMYTNNELSYKLLKKYPRFGALTPLSMSIYSQNGTINISTLTLHGMARATQIPSSDPDLMAYATLIQQALKKALPNGHFKSLSYAPKYNEKSYQIDFSSTVELGKNEYIEDFIDDFEAEFEAEMEPYGFLFPNYTNIQEELFDAHNYKEYDFYHTYSICKFDVIFPVSKLHPEAGAWAPCSFYIYKKKGEKEMHMGFLGVENWITTLNIQDENSIKPLKEAQGMIVNILKEMI